MIICHESAHGIKLLIYLLIAQTYLKLNCFTGMAGVTMGRVRARAIAMRAPWKIRQRIGVNSGLRNSYCIQYQLSKYLSESCGQMLYHTLISSSSVIIRILNHELSRILNHESIQNCIVTSSFSVTLPHLIPSVS